MAHDCDLCVIGGGSAGLTVAAGAAQLGASVILVERGEMGGDCLNYGCVPSKALIAAGHAAQAMRDAGRFGIAPVEPSVDFAATMDHVRGVIAAIAPNDSVERFEKLGVRVLRTTARFVSPDTVEANGESIRARRFVIATGSRPTAPPIPGLDTVPYLTNESVFANRQRPGHLVIVGGGPIGMEMAQAHRRLGARVTVLEAATILGKDDPDLAAVVTARLKAEGVLLRDKVKITGVSGADSGVAIELDGGERIEASHLLVAAGRAPNVEDLDLDKAGVAFTKRGITVDKRLRTGNRRVYAIGDVNGLHPFTHMAGLHGSLVIRNALFRLPVNVHAAALPWTTYTDPEIAQVGLTEAQARERHGEGVRAVRWPLRENDRAQTERETSGLVKIVTDRRGRVLGAGIVAPRAGELIHVWCLAMARRLKLGTMAQMVVPYPTLGEASKRAAGAFFTDALFSPRTRWLVRLLRRLP
ncbi:MAG: FAD-dependent oxidoreductase [Alphaproteobacteria bacterium]|nr:FAD-dependent oxidoreductase [Alphaproteobacteria bacterium]MCW5741827.1 FAD-dependent oxidoreductase [Alphaproteobacteria bacterium]